MFIFIKPMSKFDIKIIINLINFESLIATNINILLNSD
jgi:hypothetical protein